MHVRFSAHKPYEAKRGAHMRIADAQEERRDGRFILLAAYCGYMGYVGYLGMGEAIFGLPARGVQLLLGIPLGIVGLFLLSRLGALLETLCEKRARRD
jgi:hypothetical protein